LNNGVNILKFEEKKNHKTILVNCRKYKHQDFNKFEKGFFHMNDNKVFCQTCHNFNKATECIICHSDKKRAKYIHGPVATWQCFICHDKNNYLTIKQPLSVQCLKCHQEFSDAMYKAKFAHAPSVAGYCTSCHLPHIANEKYFLADRVNNLCCRCHKSKKSGYHVVRKKIKGHIDIFCTKCHNPHYGEAKFLFLKKVKTKKNLCKRCHK
jgi:predicted CXXCH cytochrome family protein